MNQHFTGIASVAIILLLSIGCDFGKGSHDQNYLHVPSPEWKDQIMYFIVTDRFMDGDSTNNDQGVGEYKKGDGRFWNGGDFKGLTQKIDYIKELGATAIWITPPVANQWRNPQKTGTGNHGYWATNFMEVDKHLGTLEDYKELSRTLHKNDMYLIQDIVVNHLGDFYTYNGPYNPNDVTQNFKIHDVDQPNQYPFNRNNALDEEDRNMAIFHFAPNFYDHSDTIKKRMYQFADLDDLNTSNPVVRDVLRESYDYWIKEVGVDGYRFDTPHMVEHEFWRDFLHSPNENHLGIIPFAKSLGKEDFIAFGETAFFSHALDNKEDAKAAVFLGTPEKPEMNSLLNFPLTMSINRVFKELKPTHLLTYRLESEQAMFEHPERLVNFIDNHDGARFLSVASRESFRQALLFVMTVPGVPCIYYGTEQEFKENARQAMFKGGVGSPDKGHFDTESAAFKFVQDLTHLRKSNELFRRGEIKVIADQNYGPGILAYQLSDHKESYLVLFNTSDSDKLLSTELNEMSNALELKLMYSLKDDPDRILIKQSGSVTGMVSPKAGLVYKVINEADQEKDLATNIQIDPWTGYTPGSTSFSGTASGIDTISACIDGASDQSVKTAVNKNGQWRFDVPITHLQNGTHNFIVYHVSAQGDIVSESQQFNIKHPLKTLAEIDDPVGDDFGLSKKYTYPNHISFTRQMDIEKIAVLSEGTNLQIKVIMGEITQIWLPPNGFDHCLLNIYIDLPNRKGISNLPKINARFPNQGEWDYFVSSGGFGNAMYSSEGANNNSNGKLVGPAPQPVVDVEKRSISLTISAEALGYPSDLKGAKIYISTWDGGPESPRGLSRNGGTWTFGGGAADDPKIMDDTEVIRID